MKAKLVGRLLPRGYFASVDVTRNCNLHCKHCYFRNMHYSNELSIGGWLTILNQLRHTFHMTWVGGEPLLRKELIEGGKSLFEINWVVTNGTLPLPSWDDVVFLVSVDGTKDFHEQIRGAGSYSRTKENVESATTKRLYLLTVLNTINYRCLTDFLREWSQTNIKGIKFDFHTPLSHNDQLWLPFQLRDKILTQLCELRSEYGNFILLTDKIANLMRSKSCHKVTKNCLVRKLGLCFDPRGKIKRPCVIEGAICEKCGCMVAFLTWAVFIENDEETIEVLRALSDEDLAHRR